jgi:glycosyltransferase involved in cell wall biosynthesis
MAGALVHCLREPARGESITEEGRRVVVERYDWSVLAEKLERVWFDCVQRGAR